MFRIINIKYIPAKMNIVKYEVWPIDYSHIPNIDFSK